MGIPAGSAGAMAQATNDLCEFQLIRSLRRWKQWTAISIRYSQSAACGCGTTSGADMATTTSPWHRWPFAFSLLSRCWGHWKPLTCKRFPGSSLVAKRSRCPSFATGNEKAFALLNITQKENLIRVGISCQGYKYEDVYSNLTGKKLGRIGASGLYVK